MKMLEVSSCIFVMFVQDGPSRMRRVTWRGVAAKFKTGMCEMKILGSEISWSILGALVQNGSPTCGVTWRTEVSWCFFL